MNCPIISVIVPVYNVEKYLEQCLLSIINQTYKNLDIIVVNDGSTDGSSKIIEKIHKMDHRIKVINKNNGGISSARNEGMKYIRGTFFTFVDSDDWLDLDMYEKMICANDKNADIISSSSKIKRAKQTNNYILKKYFLDGDVSCCNKLFSTSLIEKKTFRFDDGNVSIDVLGCYQLFSQCKSWCIVPGAFYNYRQDNLSYGRSGFSERDLNAITMTKRVFEDVQNHRPNLIRFAEYHLIHSQFDMINKAAMFGFKTDKDQHIYLLHKRDFVHNIRKRIISIVFTRYFSITEKLQMLLLCFSYSLFMKIKSKRGFKPQDLKI